MAYLTVQWTVQQMATALSQIPVLSQSPVRSQRPGQNLPHYQRQHRRQCVWRRARSKAWPTVLRWEWSTVWRTVQPTVQPTVQRTAQPLVQPIVQPIAYLMA
jgi:hypothetical protein